MFLPISIFSPRVSYRLASLSLKSQHNVVEILKTVIGIKERTCWHVCSIHMLIRWTKSDQQRPILQAEKTTTSQQTINELLITVFLKLCVETVQFYSRWLTDVQIPFGPNKYKTGPITALEPWVLFSYVSLLYNQPDFIRTLQLKLRSN